MRTSSVANISSLLLVSCKLARYERLNYLCIQNFPLLLRHLKFLHVVLLVPGLSLLLRCARPRGNTLLRLSFWSLVRLRRLFCGEFTCRRGGKCPIHNVLGNCGLVSSAHPAPVRTFSFLLSTIISKSEGVCFMRNWVAIKGRNLTFLAFVPHAQVSAGRPVRDDQ